MEHTYKAVSALRHAGSCTSSYCLSLSRLTPSCTMSLSHALALADSVRRKLDWESRDTRNHATTPEEIAAGEAEKKKVFADVLFIDIHI